MKGLLCEIRFTRGCLEKSSSVEHFCSDIAYTHLLLRYPIILQNENGPCPIMAIANVLVLRSKIELPDGIEIITARDLLNKVGKLKHFFRLWTDNAGQCFFAFVQVMQSSTQLRVTYRKNSKKTLSRIR